jgi:NAD(P)-dependent dehydrogenase (short-subunit alcohol dehydrogenase family)
MDLRGKHVLITGTTSGIGKQLSIDLIERGARVTSIDRGDVSSHERHRSLQADLLDADQVAASMKKLEGPIDILINNAGIMRRGELLESSVEDFDLLCSTHVRGAWLVLKHALPHLRPGSMVVQMSSRHAITLPSNPALYGLTKRWVIDMMETFGKTYPQYQVKIICPGPVDTPLTRVGASEEDLQKKRAIMCTPEEISAQIMKLLESDTKSRLLFDIATHTHILQ